MKTANYHCLALAAFTHFSSVFSTAVQATSSGVRIRSVSNTTNSTQRPAEGFVTSQNGSLWIGQKRIDFRSFNAPELLTGTEFEAIDTLKTLVGFGSPVTRTYVLPIYTSLWGGYIGSEKAVITGWDESADDWEYGEAGFGQIDMVLAHAAKDGVKVIIPIIGQDYGKESNDYGGNFVDLIRHRYNISSYTQAQQIDFFTDMPIRADFKKFVLKLLTRVNSVNGRIYGQDDTILAWETGNELNHASQNNTVHLQPAPSNWTIDVAEYIKSLAPNSLVMDGSFSRTSNATTAWPEESLASPAIDLFSYHYYGDGDILTFEAFNDRVRSFNKTFIVGEHGFYSTAAKYAEAISAYKCAGSLMWSLRPHSSQGGFQVHGEGSGIYSYHAPGWVNQTSSMFDPNEYTVMHTTYNESWTWLDEEIPHFPIPEMPTGLNTTVNGTTTGLWWLGAAWAEHYEIWAASSSGSFKLVADKVLDNIDAGKLFIPIDPTDANTTTTVENPKVAVKNSVTLENLKWSSGPNSNRTLGVDPAAGPTVEELVKRHETMLDFSKRLEVHRKRARHWRNSNTNHGSKNGSWYMVRAVSVDGVPGPFSAPIHVEDIGS